MATVPAIMATMLAQSQPIALDAALRLASDHYGFSGRIEPLTGERDQNFRLIAADGAEFVLKVAHAEQPEAETELAVDVLEHVAQADATLPCPRVMRNRTGSNRTQFVDARGLPRSAYLLTYLRGRPLGLTERSRRQRAGCGELAGRLSRALQGFEHAGARRALIWDVRQAAEVLQLVDTLTDLGWRDAAGELLRMIVPIVENRLPALRHQVVHNDLNAFNVLVDAGDPARITGVIDFGDVAYTALIADVAVTAAEQIPEECVAERQIVHEAIADVVAAYDACMPLRREELELLGTLVAARLITGLVVQQWHLNHNPSGGHYAALDASFVERRLDMAQWLVRAPQPL